MAGTTKEPSCDRPPGSNQDMITRPNTRTISAISSELDQVAEEAGPRSESTSDPARAPGRRAGRRPVVRPLAEQRAPDPDDRRALLDRDLEVVAHAHRQLRRRAPASASAASSDSSPQGDERRPGIVRIARPAGRRSSARGPRGASARAPPDRRARAPPGSKPALAGSRSTLTWSSTGTRSPGRTSRDEAIQPPGRLDGVDRLDDGERLQRPACLVRLEWPDQVPRRAIDERRPSPRPPGRGSRRASSGPRRRPPGSARRRPSS